MNKIESALEGIISSFTSNLRPSAIGWSTPKAPAYSGPILCWAAADIFLSNQLWPIRQLPLILKLITLVKVARLYEQAHLRGRSLLQFH